MKFRHSIRYGQVQVTSQVNFWENHVIFQYFIFIVELRFPRIFFQITSHVTFVKIIHIFLIFCIVGFSPQILKVHYYGSIVVISRFTTQDISSWPDKCLCLTLTLFNKY